MRKTCPYSDLFWSAFSRIRTEYGERRSISQYSVQMPENAGQNNSKFGRFLRSEYLKRSFFFEKFKTKSLLLYKIYYLTAICHDNHIALGDFNMDSSHTQLQVFIEHYNYCSLIKNNTCFKGRGSCIDSILTNKKYFFKNTSSFETGISDHHHLIHSMLKTKFEKEESKKVTYRNYKQFQWENVEKDLTNSLGNCNGEYENYEQNFMCLIHPPRKNTS